MEMRGVEDEGDLELSTFDEERSSRGLLSRVIAIASVTALTFGGYTLAASIGLGSGSAQEFGQGVQVTSACDPTIESKPISKFRNDSIEPTFLFTGLKISGVSEECKDKLFVARIYGETGSALNLGANFPRTVLKFHFSNSGWAVDVPGCYLFSSAQHNSVDSNQVQFTNDDTCIDSIYWKQWFTSSSKVYRYTLETRENTVRSVDVTYAKGDGRTVGYVMDTGGEGTTSAHVPNFNNMRFYVDALNTRFWSIFIELTQAEFNTGNSIASSFNVSTSSGTTCQFAGVSSIGTASRAPGVDGSVYRSTLRSAEYVCETNSPSTITIS